MPVVINDGNLEKTKFIFGINIKKMRKNIMFFWGFLFVIISCSKESESNSGGSTFGRKSIDNYNSHSISLPNFDAKTIPKMQWTSEYQDFSRFSNAVVSSNTIFAPSTEGLLKVDASNGKTISILENVSIHQEQPVLDNGILYFGSDEVLYAYDIKSEKILWSSDISHPLISLPLVTKNLIIIGDITEGIYAINKTDGKLNWFYSCISGIDLRSGIAGDENALVFGGRGGDIYCLETATGKEKWIYKTCSQNLGCPVVACPTISNNIVYAGDLSGMIFAVDFTTGKEVWKKKYDSKIDWQNVAVNDKSIIITGQSSSLKNNFIYCLDKLSGIEVWSFKKATVTVNETISDPLIINNNYVLFATYDGVSLMDITTKEVLWTISQNQSTSPTNANVSTFGYTIAEGKLYFIGFGGKMFGYEL